MSELMARVRWFVMCVSLLSESLHPRAWRCLPKPLRFLPDPIYWHRNVQRLLGLLFALNHGGAVNIQQFAQHAARIAPAQTGKKPQVTELLPGLRVLRHFQTT